jgi:hypothetical protein
MPLLVRKEKVSKIPSRMHKTKKKSPRKLVCSFNIAKSDFKKREEIK